MKKLFFILFAALLVQAAAARETMSLDGTWRFRKDDATGYGWVKVTVPHCWNAEDGTSPDYYRGACSYEREFDVTRKMAGKRLFLRFEAVSSAAEVLINGQCAGRHKGAYTAFCFEITNLVREGSNTLTVKATNAKDPAIAPLSGDFTVFGGIYRPVSLLVSDKVCITPLDHASCGVYIRQSEVSADKASLDITVKISNGTDTDQTADGTVSFTDRHGKTVATGRIDALPIPAGETRSAQVALTIERPELWNGRENPALYKTEAKITTRSGYADAVTDFTGFRYYSIDPQKGFLLNGRRVKLRGVNRHQDIAGKGYAVTHADHERDMQMIADMGANAIRLAHYPHADCFYRLCDREGMLVWAEIPFVDILTPGSEFAEVTEQQLVELIRQNYNRPSIVFWSLYNELKKPASPELDPAPLVARLNQIAHLEDPTRLTVGAQNLGRRPENYISDYVATNIYPGWYGDQPEAMNAHLDRWYEQTLRKGIAVSEYGAGASIRDHEEGMTAPPRHDGHWHPEEWQACVHEKTYEAIASRDWVWGSFVWNMFDFGSAVRDEGDTKGMNDKGLVTYDRSTPKDAYYFYQASWAEKPMVHICSQRFTPRTKAATQVKVYSNCEPVRITLNGKELTVENRSGVIYTAPATLRKGKNTIVATAGQTTDRCEWVLE